jgi:very-short-patch-repair endonuclease
MRGEQPWRTNRSRALRSRPISAEAKLWSRLRNRRLGGHKFVRQMPIDPYFVDFVCRECKVVVEVDGGTHSTEQEVAADVRRTLHLKRLGYRGFRISNDDVYHNLDCVLDALLAFIAEPVEGAEPWAAPHPGPLPAPAPKAHKPAKPALAPAGPDGEREIP